MDNLVWYAPYASNLSWYRFSHYLEGGVLAETGRDHVGARDPSPPRAMKPLRLPGQMYFATESPFWGGGRALYDPEADGETVARGYLITPQQFSDVLSQEMRLPPEIDWTFPIKPGGSLRIGDGHYETIVCTEEFEGRPVVTFCAPWRFTDVPWLAPVPSYLGMIGRGLLETVDAWTIHDAAEYLEALAGVHHNYTTAEIERMMVTF